MRLALPFLTPASGKHPCGGDHQDHHEDDEDREVLADRRAAPKCAATTSTMPERNRFELVRQRERNTS
jgi:hypothetical protein